jgi:hypothetical protein
MSFVFLEDDEVPHKLDDVARLNFYNTYGYTEECFDDKDVDIRYNAYEKLGYTEKAFNDTSVYIRRKAYDNLGYTKKALHDKDSGIRYEAYEKLGYTEEALHDKDYGIVFRATQYFAARDIINLTEDFGNPILNNIVKKAKTVEDIGDSDNETAHMEEDDLMFYIIENMHNFNKDEIKIIQKIMKDVNNLPYSRVYE